MAKKKAPTRKPRKSGATPSDSRLVVVANRLPVKRVQEGDRQRWETSPGGLVSAVAPFLKERGGAWIGWDGTGRDLAHGSPVAPFTHDGINIRPVGLSYAELDAFYHGFSNATIWPLYHDSIRAPQFHRRWWHPYREVNMRFAQAAVETAGEHDSIWVHDYQLQLVPGYVRMHRPKAHIGFFLHIPFPPEELFAKMPWRAAILENMLGADVVGFQTKLAANNFARAARMYTSAKGSDTQLQFEGRKVRVNAYPISIDFEHYEQSARTPEVQEHVAKVREDLGGRRIVLAVDRLDYTKGIEFRLRAFEELLRRGRIPPEGVVFVQIAVPTREKVDEYADLRSDVNEHVGRINGTYGAIGLTPVHYIYNSVPFTELMAMYAAADVLMVTPLRDGMNLVAKEYVAARSDNSGVLVLSEFAGAALEMTQAVTVNPYDVDGMADALERALSMDPGEGKRRMAALRRVVQRHTVYDWAGAFLGALGENE
ncbi:MAG: trehalose-6-phosphate synthase [Planctomycetota bacterium]